MKKNYLQPKLAVLGDAKEVIKGDCGWGSENAYLDKTGYTRKSWRQRVTTTIMSLSYWISQIECKYQTVCDDNHEC